MGGYPALVICPPLDKNIKICYDLCRLVYTNES